MKKILFCLVCFVALGAASAFIGANSVSALRANAFWDEGCYVRNGPGENDYVLDPSCSGHYVIKYNDEGNVEFFNYQDHAQTTWRPSQGYRNSFEQCVFTGPNPPDTICGTVYEIVTPSGEYKSWFNTD